MTMHVNERTGEISSPDEILKRARQIEKEITALDTDIADRKEALKEVTASRDKLARELRAVVRPVPLFDAAEERPFGDTTMTLTGPDGKTTDVTDAMNALAKKRKH